MKGEQKTLEKGSVKFCKKVTPYLIGFHVMHIGQQRTTIEEGLENNTSAASQIIELLRNRVGFGLSEIERERERENLESRNGYFDYMKAYPLGYEITHFL